MTKQDFMKRHNFNDLDFRNLERYEETRKSGVMNMFEYLYLMKKYNINGGYKLATWIQSGNNYEDFMRVLKNEKT